MSSGRENGSALGKALLVLEALLEAGGRAGLGEIAGRLDLPRQSVYRMARQLEDQGLIRRELVDDVYSVGGRLISLGSAAFSCALQSLPLNTVLRDLVADVGETCNVGVLDRGEVLYVERVECDWPLRLQFGPGSRVPVHATAIGKLLLAHLPNRSRKRLLEAAPLERFTEFTVTDPDRLDGEFREIRRQGFATSDQETLLGMVALAVPIRDVQGRVVAGLAVHAPLARLAGGSIEDYLAKLLDAAERIGTGLNDLAAEPPSREPGDDTHQKELRE